MFGGRSGQPMTRQASLLMDYLKRLERRTHGRKASHIHISRLDPENRKDHHKRIASDAFSHIVQAQKGQLFSMANDDIIFVYDETISDEVDAAMVKLKFLFADDPLLTSPETSAKDRFVTSYDLRTEFPELMAVAQRLAAWKGGARPASGGARGGGSRGATGAVKTERAKGKPLTPATLARIEKALSSTDFANMVRRQSVCAMVGNAPPQVLFDEVFVAISDLQATILPDTNLGLSPWLFQHMTETLDRRVLANINKHDDGSLNSDFSINLNVSTVLSSDFLKFDDNINASMRNSIVIEMQVVDIFSDLASYLLARDFAQDRGYRICVDGLSPATLPYVDRTKLGADLVKVFWSDDLADAVVDNPEVKDNIKRLGTTRVILCRVDDEMAVEIGHSMGVTLFQGRHVQRILLSDPRRRRVGTTRI